MILTARSDIDAITYGDVIVFKKPPENMTVYVKRIVGLPGDHIRMVGGLLHINGTPADRKPLERISFKADAHRFVVTSPFIETLPNGSHHQILELQGDRGPLDDTDEFIVLDDHVFVLGDNRDRSHDSRVMYDFGYLPKANILGLAKWIVFPNPRTIDK